MEIKDRQDRKCLLLRAYINGGITVSSVASEFPEVEREIREFLAKKYGIPMPAPKVPASLPVRQL